MLGMNMNIILNVLDILSIFAFPRISIKMMILDLVTSTLYMFFRK
jgi:hypothetical protein